MVELNHRNKIQNLVHQQSLANTFSESPEEISQRLVAQLSSFNFSSFTDRLRFLHNQLINADLPQEQLWKSYLLAGCKMFSMEQGGFYKVVNPTRPRSLSQTDGMAGLCANVSNTEVILEFVTQTLKNNKICAGNLSAEQVTIKVDSGALELSAKTYLAALVNVGEKVFGVMLFLSSESKQSEYSDLDRETLKLMAEGVARMIELRNVQPAGGSLDLEHFATDGVSGLREYMEKASLPQLYGIPNRVVEILVDRIGTQALGIDHIAETLNLSKRTLQRRLQQQDMCFADIRDQVRFHFAIEYLVRGQDSIDGISSSLDFSDRTSFTNAFKRWTGLSPSTFRKLFRDYA